MFKDTPRFREAISVINSSSTIQLHNFLSKLVDILLNNRSSFSSDELSEFATALKLSSTDLSVVHSSSCFIFEQCIYSDVSSSDLSQGLSSLGMLEKKVLAFNDIWTNYSEQLLLSARDRHLSGRSFLESSHWQLKVTTSHAHQDNCLIPSIVLKLGIGGPSPRSIALEFNKTQLEALFETVELITTRVDSL
ncbi:hypothetical protein RCL1_007209 [Eukaryota sp. TZLM3-RCL]